MTDSSNITLVGESLRHIHEDGLEGLVNIMDIWRHEGLKKGTEIALYAAGQHRVSRWLLEQVAGGPLSDPRLRTNVGGIELDGPVGIAPGVDKMGMAVLGWQALGAHHSTPGGVAYDPQQGKPMPRLRTFDDRVGDHGTSKSLNALGFPTKGVSCFKRNIEKQKETGALRIPVIPQLTLNKELYDEENRHLIPARLAETAQELLSVADGFNLGLSSPNTIGMRDTQAFDFLYACIMAVREVTDLPLGLKGDGDGGEERLDLYCRLAQATGLNYLELINSTTLRRIKQKYGAEDMPGGLAGADPDYQDLAVESVSYAYEAVGDKTDIMGVGGINAPVSAMRMVRAGASALNINTAVRQHGVKAVTFIERGLSAQMDKLPPGTLLPHIIGADTRRGPKLAA